VQSVPGLTSDDEIDMNDVSCVPGGSCYGVGDVSTFSGSFTSFLVTDTKGTWSKPAPIPGLATAFGDDAFPDPELIACPAAGDCLITGEYTAGPGFDGNPDISDFVLEEKRGSWQKPVAINGLAALNTGGEADIDDASCPAAGYCTIVGDYSGAHLETSSGYVATEVDYRWGKATQVPGLAKLNVGGDAGDSTLACPTPRNCTIVGMYAPAAQAASARTGQPRGAARAGGAVAVGAGSGAVAVGAGGGAVVRRAGRPAGARLRYDSPPPATDDSAGLFADSEVNGSWQQSTAARLRGLTATGFADTTSNLACASAGNCLLGGSYSATASTGSATSFLLTEAKGTWSATYLPGEESILAVACPSLGNCVVGGNDARGVAATWHQASGTWTTPAELPGATSLSYRGHKSQDSDVTNLACPSAGNCTAGGFYLTDITSANPLGLDNDFVASAAGGTWSAATVPAGLAALNGGGDAGYGFSGLACAAGANCAAVGQYLTANENYGAFLLAEVPLKATSAAIGLAQARVTEGKEQSEKISVTVTAKGGTPGGKVSVSYGSHLVCVITLKSGKGSCALSAKRLATGTYHLTASYPGSFGFAKSASKAVTLAVVS
jgi:hypothetical protein